MDKKIWHEKLKLLYESNAANQFLIYGNIYDCFLFTKSKSSKYKLGNFYNYLSSLLLTNFSIIIKYDIGNGLKIDKGWNEFSKWPSCPPADKLPKNPIQAIQFINNYLLFTSNLSSLNKNNIGQTAIYISNAEYVFPASQTTHDDDINSISYIVKEWGENPRFTNQSVVSFLTIEKINDLHQIITNSLKSEQIQIPLPNKVELKKYFELTHKNNSTALKEIKQNTDKAIAQLIGISFSSLDKIIKINQHINLPIKFSDLANLKKEIIERDCQGLIEFIKSDKTLDNIYGHEKIKKWMKQDIKLWGENKINAIPMGYLLSGPVGTGKTFIVECLAGEADIPVVKFKNFRDKWIGSTEGNLQKIFSLLQAIGKCIVFIDEADQALGRRDSRGDSSQVSGRVYSMMAKEMSKTDNRGKLLWVLATSRPDLVEIDLKRPGRIDVKIPLFPTHQKKESFKLIKALSKKNNITIKDSTFTKYEKLIPKLLTPGAAENIAVKIYRLINSSEKKITPENALVDILDTYQNPIPKHIMEKQIQLAKEECSDIEFIPKYFRTK